MSGRRDPREDDVESLEQALRRWDVQSLSPALRRQPERQDAFSNSAGEVQRLYTPLDIEDVDCLEDVGFPGEFPYTRGVQPSMYRGRLWSIRQYAGFGTPEETNQRFKFLLSEGQPGLSAAFDLPTQLGRDSDDAIAAGEVGRAGVAVDTLHDMEVMFNGLPLDRISVSMTINAPAAVLVAMYAAVGEKQGVPPDKITGTVQNDILKEYVARGTYIFPPRPSLRLAADLIAYCARQMPSFNSISVSGYHIRDAGSTAAQEMAFAFANAIAYIKAVQERGLAVDAFAPRISWIFNTQNNFLEEVAKYRALRRVWARLMRDRFGARDPRSWTLRTHVQTGGATLTAQQAENNIVRAALQALASVLGGVQSLALSCYDEALSLPAEHAQQIAVRTQQIIAYESGAADTVDPLGGCYLIERLTSDLERLALGYLERIDEMGGAVAAIEAGYMQREIQEAAWAYQREVDDGVRTVVGVNRFQGDEDRRPAIFKVRPEVEAAQKRSLAQVKSDRDGAQAGATLSRLEQAARDDADLMPPIIEAVKSYATMGEICGILRGVFGEYRPAQVI